MKRHINLIFRGLKIFALCPKPVLLSRTISAVLNAAVPFINIYFSAQILNELAGAKNQERIVMLVLLTIGLNLISSFIVSLIGKWASYCNSASYNLMSKVYSDKLFSMDFMDAENPEIQQEYSEIS